jgi:hypothetical protein
MNLRIPINKALSRKYKTVDVLLCNGSVVQKLAIDASGIILGKVVGGQDGLDESPLPFKQGDIEAYRFRSGLRARFGLAKWQPLKQRTDAN